MDRRLIDYLPSFVQGYREIKAIMDAEQTLIEQTLTETDNVLADQFVVSATENGVSRYEKTLGITPKGTYTLDERKFNILARMNEQLPYTEKQLHNSLASLCGADGYTVKLDADVYKMTVKLALSNEHNIEAVEELLHKMLPANILYKVALFNTHSILSAFTHEQLAQYTYKEVREGIL